MAEITAPRTGRVFCITGYSQSNLRSASAASSRSSTSGSITTLSSTSTSNSAPSGVAMCQSDNDSSTSGYLSSSFESSSEEKRLVPSEEKVFRLWERLDLRRGSAENMHPRNSTPKQQENRPVRRLLPNISLVLKGSFVDSRLRTSSDSDMTKDKDKTFDSFWDIDTPQMFKCRSESDVRLQNASCAKKDRTTIIPKDHQSQQYHQQQSSVRTASGIRIQSETRDKSTLWKRKPYLTLSNSSSDLDLRLSGSDGSYTGTNCSDYQTLPRYRVKMDGDKEPLAREFSNSTKTNSTNKKSFPPNRVRNNEDEETLVRKFSNACADIVDVGLPVDESMGEFLANVDKDNLAGLLDFYDRMTNTAEYERARRNPRNYEAVYY